MVSGTYGCAGPEKRSSVSLSVSSAPVDEQFRAHRGGASCKQITTVLGSFSLKPHHVGDGEENDDTPVSTTLFRQASHSSAGRWLVLLHTSPTLLGAQLGFKTRYSNGSCTIGTWFWGSAILHC